MAEAAEQQPFLSGTADAGAGGLGQLQDQVWEEVRRAIKLTNQTEAFWDNLMAFVHAVDWTVCSSTGGHKAASSMDECSPVPCTLLRRRPGSEASWRDMWPSSCWCCCAGETPACSQACSCC
jgi:hypothetical protein